MPNIQHRNLSDVHLPITNYEAGRAGKHNPLMRKISTKSPRTHTQREIADKDVKSIVSAD